MSTPQVIALDNEEAVIEVGEDVPVGTTSTPGTGGTVSTSIDRKQATIKLTIKPFISPDSNKIRLNIKQDIKQVSDLQVSAKNLKDSAVSLITRNLQTSIVVEDKETAVLGGLMVDQEVERIKKVPVLGDIPILGWLFKGRDIEKTKRNLVLFITPNIIRNSQDFQDILTQKIDERISFIQKNFNGKDAHGYMLDQLRPRAVKTNSNGSASLTDEILNSAEEPSSDSKERAQVPDEEEPESEEPAKESF